MLTYQNWFYYYLLFYYFLLVQWMVYENAIKDYTNFIKILNAIWKTLKDLQVIIIIPEVISQHL